MEHDSRRLPWESSLDTNYRYFNHEVLDKSLDLKSMGSVNCVLIKGVVGRDARATPTRSQRGAEKHIQKEDFPDSHLLSAEY